MWGKGKKYCRDWERLEMANCIVALVGAAYAVWKEEIRIPVTVGILWKFQMQAVGLQGNRDNEIPQSRLCLPGRNSKGLSVDRNVV